LNVVEMSLCEGLLIAGERYVLLAEEIQLIVFGEKIVLVAGER